MRIAIMQPYFLPYIGYFHLLEAVDLFVIYDNIQYTKKGWINRNRMLVDGEPAVFSLPLAKASNYLNVCERTLAADFDRRKLLNRFREAYRKAPCAGSVLPVLEAVVMNPENNLFEYLHDSVKEVLNFLGMEKRLVVSSSLPVDHSLKGVDKVLAICEHLQADTYVNAIGGQGLYSREAFGARGVDLHFIKSRPTTYGQFAVPFVPWLSIIDVIMFNDLPAVGKMLTNYELI